MLTSYTVTDPVLIAQFRQASGFVEILNPSGKVIGIMYKEKNSESEVPVAIPNEQPEPDKRQM